MTKVELNITGTVESLHLEPGDRIIVTVEDSHVTADHVSSLRDQLQKEFPDHEVLVLKGLRIARETTCA